MWMAIVCAIAVGGRFLADLIQKDREEKQRQESIRLSEQRAAEERARAHRDSQLYLKNSMLDLRKTGADRFNEIPSHLLLAESFLDSAEQEFSVRAFSPFWEAIERTIRCIGEVYNSAKSIEYAAESYEKYAKDLEGTKDMFSVSTRDLDFIRHKCRLTEARMAPIIRKAQTDFQFSTIYEQRKTNAILVAGFQSLGDAISGLSNQLMLSMDSLENKLESIENTFRAHHSASMEFSAAIAQEALEQRASIAAEQSAAATKQIEMLDNLQRGREPLRSERGPRRVGLGTGR